MELFFLPANSAVESVYYWVNSSNKEIFKLMLWLVYLDLRECFRLIIIWVAWTMNQIVAVIDGFSRGYLTDGIASYGSILDFLLLNETSFNH